MTVMSEDQQAKVAALRDSIGVEVDALLVASGEEGVTERTLRRWLVARKWDVAAAAQDLTAHARWRADYLGGTNRIKDEDVAAELAQNKSFLQGVDTMGHPTTIVVGGNHTPAKDVAQTKKFIVYCLDAATRLGQQNPLWDGKCVGIFDLSAMTMSNGDVAALRAIFDLLQNHYVERLYKMYLYCAPVIFWGIWKLVSPFVDPVTKEKVVFVYAGDAAETFQKDYDPAVLPRSLGGTADLKPLDVAWKEIEAAEAAAAAQAAAPQPSSE